MRPPFSVGFVVASERALGCLFSFYSLMLLVYGFYGLLHSALTRVLGSFGLAVLLAASAAGCFYTSAAFLKRQRWAWSASWAVGLFVAAVGSFFLWQSSHRWPGGHGEVSLLVGLVSLLLALIGLLLLILPQTRRYVHSAQA
ncbi:hypothetical protein [Edaphobacter bradus]|uniref:hypothetical protein n=1 Tax=Edaphobacter bradus TaxID=2259016 RepID=UPI0021DF8ADC|nr:hypothetical protein [Edaphobacter bradus]